MTKRRSTYHHADLRRALLDAAVVFLRAHDVTGLTMQTLARAAGVSPGAPYHHFPDKVSLVAALATEGFERWLEAASAAVGEGGTPRAQLEALGFAWLAFAKRHPSHYRVMFLPDLEDRRRFAELHETSGRGLALLASVVQAGLPGARSETVLSRAIAAFASLHGFASLRQANVLTNIPALPTLARLERELVDQVVRATFEPA